MFTLPPQYPTPLPPALAGAAALADRVEGLLNRFCDSHPDENPELLIRAARAVWNLTAVRKTIYLLTNPGADRRHRRGKPDATMTFIEHRVSELHDWVAEYQRLVIAMKRNPSQFVVTPSGGSPSETYNIQHIDTVSSLASNVSPESNSVPPQPSTHNPQLFHANDSSSDDNNPAANPDSPSLQDNPNSASDSPSAPSAPPLPLCDQESTPSQLLRPLPAHMNSTPPLRNPLGTALATARETVAIANEANIPFDRANFFPAEIDPAAAIADALSHQCKSDPYKSNQSQDPCPPPSSPNSSPPETITFRNRQVTLTGKPMPPNDLPPLPNFPNPRQSPRSQNPSPLPTIPPPVFPPEFPPGMRRPPA